MYLHIASACDTMFPPILLLSNALEHLTFNQVLLLENIISDPLAQLAEHLTFNQVLQGSFWGMLLMLLSDNS